MDEAVSENAMLECKIELTAIATTQSLKKRRYIIFVTSIGRPRTTSALYYYCTPRLRSKLARNTSAAIFCHRLTAHQTHQNPSKIVILALKYNHPTQHPPTQLQTSKKTAQIPTRIHTLRTSATKHKSTHNTTSRHPAEVSQRCR